MFALVNINTGKVCAVSETELDLKRKLNSVICMRMLFKNSRIYSRISSKSASENWDDYYYVNYRIESVGFDDEIQ